jgi:hypothetical protein
MAFFLIILGTFIAIFERFTAAQSKPNFNIVTFLEKNWTVIVLNILTSLGLYFALFYGETLPEFKPFWNFDLFNLFIIITGAVSLYVWKGLISLYKMLFKKKVDSVKGK